jgi:hypothetical protein
MQVGSNSETNENRVRFNSQAVLLGKASALRTAE